MARVIGRMIHTLNEEDRTMTNITIADFDMPVALVPFVALLVVVLLVAVIL